MNIALLSLLLAAQFESVPLEWTCSPRRFGAFDGCDCGCGVIDPDCVVDPALPAPGVARSSCASHNCGDGIPATDDVGRCADNVCGDGYRGGAETCDDGQQPTGLDGCSADCSFVEPGFRCSKEGQGCRQPGCGDGEVEPRLGEQCDDLNDVPGDGCDACTAELGFLCFTFQQCFPVTCGNLFVEFDSETQSGETCEDGNDVAGDGCDRCQTEPGYVCSFFAPGPFSCTRVECGDGSIARNEFGLGEACDDGNQTNGDGCDTECRVEDGFFCDFGPCQRVICGDRQQTPNEACDDGNVISGDGCSGDCLSLEPGFFCPFGEPCRAVICGDGRAESDAFGSVFEECDDGNTAGGDGCGPTCLREPGFLCFPDGTCRVVTCGDGLVDGFFVGGNEVCDDGNSASGDGCDSSCTFVESGFSCASPGAPCARVVCGDGAVAPSEQCDDGNDNDGDGCTAFCQREAGFVCGDAGQPCEQLPKAWTCSRFVFGVGDGCDCGCGAVDPDCPADAGFSDCDFNGCLEAAPFIDTDDVTSCTTEPPDEEVVNPPEPDPPPPDDEDDEPVGGNDDTARNARLRASCAGADGTSLVALLLLLRRRRRPG